MADKTISSDEDLRSAYKESEHCEEAVRSSMRDPEQTIQLITKESLLRAQREDLRKVMDFFDVKEKAARTLLIHYRWDFQRLQDAIAETIGFDLLFSRVGVARLTLASTNFTDTFCKVCMNVPGDTTMMDCGHTFCNACWTRYFLVKINDGHSKRIKCMAPECNVICDEDIIRKLVSAKDPGAAQRFDRFLFESYIDDNDKVKWCPSVPHCGNAVRVEGDVYCEIQCTCGHQFCFNCLAQPHSPCSCLIWELWDKKCQDECETQNWIAVNTRSCPKCRNNVQRNYGCNCMICVCGQEFCWTCGGALQDLLADHVCSRYKDDQKKDIIEKAQRDSKRYTQYYSRWKAHEDALNLEAKFTKLIRKNNKDLESKEEYGWLINAVQRLFRSRHALAYSYPFAFHMFGEDISRDKLTAAEKELKQKLFEDLQQQLEETVERLSKIMAAPPLLMDDRQTVMANRQQVIDLSGLADTRCRKLYEWIQNDLVREHGLTSHRIASYNSQGVLIPSDT